jgi:hypothetical protein
LITRCAQALSPEALQPLDAHALRAYAVVALHRDIRPWSVLRGGQSRSRRQSCWVVWDFGYPQTHREALCTRAAVAPPSSECPLSSAPPIRTGRTSTRCRPLPNRHSKYPDSFSRRWWGCQSAGAGPRPVPGSPLLSSGQCRCAGVKPARDRQTGHEVGGFHCGSAPLAISDNRRAGRR